MKRTTEEKTTKGISNKSRQKYKAIGLIVIGVLFLMDTLFNINIWGRLIDLWPLILVVWGINLLYKREGEE